MNEKDSALSQRHAGFYTPEETIFDLIKNQTGSIPIKRTKIVRGYESEVYDVATREGVSFIVRIQQYGEVSYDQEQWAMEQCRNNGVPVPRIYALGRVTIAGKEREYMMQEKARGQPLGYNLHKILLANGCN